MTDVTPDEMLAALVTTTGNLNDYIEARAHEIADPRVAAVLAELNTRITAMDSRHLAEMARADALKDELRRQLAAQCRQVGQLWPEVYAWRAVNDLHQPYYTGPKKGQCRGCDEVGIEVLSPCRTREVGERARVAAVERAKAQAVNHD